MDIRAVDPAALVDIRDVNVNTALPKRERILDFIRQIGNPYCYRHGKYVVRVSFADTDISLEDRLKHISEQKAEPPRHPRQLCALQVQFWRKGAGNMQNSKETKIWNATLYLRLSRDDGDKEESNSITGQRELLRDFIRTRPELREYAVRIDDGFTGSNFDRPSFKKCWRT